MREVFRRLDYPFWRLTAHNPVQMLHMVPASHLDQAARDPSFLAVYDAATAELDRLRGRTDTWWQRRFPDLAGRTIAYFSAEFALHQSLPIYAGGLGVLAGDHCKEASNLGIPLVCVGFMYPMGYFHQRISPEGWQIESYGRLSFNDVAVERALTAEGQPLLVAVPLGQGILHLAVWLVRIARVRLLLLDTDVPENSKLDRDSFPAFT